MSLLLSVLAWAVPAVFGACVAFALVAYALMIRHRRLPTETILELSLASGDVRREMLDLPWESAMVPTPGGYRLSAHFLPGTRPVLALFHHGVGWDWHGMQRYMEAFIAAGWCVAALDSRGHGKSEGPGPSYGWFEKRDAIAVIDWASGKVASMASEKTETGDGASWPTDGRGVPVVLLGESMGAASVLQASPLDGRIAGVIADSAFSSAAKELDHRLSRAYLPNPLRFLVVALVDLACRAIDGFSLYRTSPESAIMSTSIPILFIAGKEDDYVPWRFSVEMYERRKESAPTELALFDGAIHARAWKTDRVRYDSLAVGFAERALAAGNQGASSGVAPAADKR
jgi:hypothetical protein